MKSTTIATALLATIAVAQPHHGHHGHHRRHQREHEKREIVVEWETAWVTETVIVDETGTSTIPAATPTSEAVTSAYSAAQFYETSAASETPEVKPSSQAPPPPPPAPTTPTTYAAPAPPTTLMPTTKAAPTPSAVPPPPPPPPVESTYVAPPPPPPPTTVEAPPPAPTTAQAPPPPKPQPTSYPADGGSDAPSGGAKKTGDITYYAPGMGSCGYDDSNPTMNVVAVSKDWFSSVSSLTNAGVNKPTNPLCDKTITITTDKGKKTTAVIRDSCPGCDPTSIDVTEGTFLELFDSLDIGRGTVTWWLNEEVAGA